MEASEQNVKARRHRYRHAKTDQKRNRHTNPGPGTVLTVVKMGTSLPAAPDPCQSSPSGRKKEAVGEKTATVGSTKWFKLTFKQLTVPVAGQTGAEERSTTSLRHKQ